MKRLLITSLMISAATYAEDAAKIKEPAPATIEKSDNWPTLQNYWKSEGKTGNDFKDALVNGVVSAQLLLGYEYANLDDIADRNEAHALISRIRLNYKTGSYKGFDAFAQMQYVGPISDKHAPKDQNYDTVPDPEKFRFHQLYLTYKGYDTVAKIGAQEILLDNQRFIGNVGWRLNAQSFNAAMAQNNSIEDLTLIYAYADSINQANGENNDNRQYHMLNAAYNLGENNHVSGFAYLQRNDAPSASEKLDTYGVRFWGKNETFVHNAMLAFQRDAYYGSLSGMLDFEPADVEMGIEYISGGSDNDERFQTLNGTAHGFNGWADQFLGTGGGLAGGLVDVWIKAATAPSDDLKLSAIYHYFNTAANTGAGQFSGTYGNEIDLRADYTVSKNVKLIAKAAHYIREDGAATNFTRDETVLWLRGVFQF